MLERTRARLQALQMLYQREITGEDVESILVSKSYSSEDGEPSEYCRELAIGTELNQVTIDAEIESTSEHWAISRMPLVDRNILRLAVYEINFRDEVPDSVAINEAVEMAKTYGGEDSSKFVNGVLGRIAERHLGEMETLGGETEER
ncbi:MAG: transcription antitermination factor NusB [Actinomycetota bacterium]|nr:MAG: N utilization substance protein [Actinomycetota bacterium]MDO8949341.1 transcription antitermination factor NusB [Actinomycetota bacterium]MDP3630071.1 transcription antitermination factor NusB [Actinomycetota bacterium]